MFKDYIRKPRPAKAVQYVSRSDNMATIIAELRELCPCHSVADYIRADDGSFTLSPGDWLVKDDKGFRAYPDELFVKEYMQTPVQPSVDQMLGIVYPKGEVESSPVTKTPAKGGVKP